MAGNLELHVTSPTLKKLFNSVADLLPAKNSPVSGELLYSINIRQSIEKIFSLSKNVTLKKDIPFDTKKVDPGTVYVFEVDVVCENKRLRVKERVSFDCIRFRIF